MLHKMGAKQRGPANLNQQDTDRILESIVHVAKELGKKNAK